MKVIFSKQKVLGAMVGLALLMVPSLSLAQQGSATFSLPQGSVSPGSPQGSVTSNSLINPLSVDTICGLLVKILSILVTLGTPIAVLFIVYAGFLFVKARGNATELQIARRNLLYVVLGIGIFLGAWVLGQVIANTIKQLAPPGTITGGNSCS